MIIIIVKVVRGAADDSIMELCFKIYRISLHSHNNDTDSGGSVK